VNKERVFTLHRIKNRLGYRPGNLKWADKSEQRDEQDRNHSKTKRRR
jgi:hypothetical protein